MTADPTINVIPHEMLMKILANLECLQPPLTGIGHYTKQLALHLASHPDVDRFRGLYRNRWLGKAQLHDWPPAKAGALQRAEDTSWLRRMLRDAPGSYALRHQLRKLRFTNQTRHTTDDVYWEPGLELMPFAGRRVATVYDLSHLAIPAAHPVSRIAYLTRQIDHSLRHADTIVTISYTMQREIAAYSGLAEADIAVVPPAASPAFHPLTDKTPARRQLGLPERYILSVGTLEPRKNMERLIQAYVALPDKLREKWPLVCVGAKGWSDTQLNQQILRLETRGELIRLGYVSQQKLPLITACADLLAYPSLYEGFGMPVVEAMACGVPVLTSRNTSMHEITQGHAFLVEPTDVDDIKNSLLSAVNDPERRHRLSSQGKQLAARYDWDTSAAELISSLRGTPPII